MKNFINSLRNDQSVTFSANFDGLEVPAVRRPWEPGCHISVPSDYVSCFQQTPDGRMVLPFVPVLVTCPDGDQLCDKLFLNTLTKAVRTSAGAYFRTHGTVVDRVRQFRTWDEALRYGLSGRTFVITDDLVCSAISPEGHERRTHIYCFDFVKD